MQDLLTEALITISGRRHLKEKLSWEAKDLADDMEELLPDNTPLDKPHVEKMADAIVKHASQPWSIRELVAFVDSLGDEDDNRTIYEILKQDWHIDAPELRNMFGGDGEESEANAEPEQAQPEPAQEPAPTPAEPQPQEQDESDPLEDEARLQGIGNEISRIIEEFFSDNDWEDPDTGRTRVTSEFGPKGVGIFFEGMDMQEVHDMDDDLFRQLDSELGDECWMVARIGGVDESMPHYGIIAFLKGSLTKEQIEQENEVSSRGERGVTYTLINSDDANEKLEEAHRDDPEVVKLTKEIKDDAERLKELGISTKGITDPRTRNTS